MLVVCCFSTISSVAVARGMTPKERSCVLERQAKCQKTIFAEAETKLRGQVRQSGQSDKEKTVAEILMADLTVKVKRIVEKAATRQVDSCFEDAYEECAPRYNAIRTGRAVYSYPVLSTGP